MCNQLLTKRHSQHEQGIGATLHQEQKNTKNYQKLSFKKLKKPRNSIKNSNKICFRFIRKLDLQQSQFGYLLIVKTNQNTTLFIASYWR